MKKQLLILSTMVLFYSMSFGVVYITENSSTSDLTIRAVDDVQMEGNYTLTVNSANNGTTELKIDELIIGSGATDSKIEIEEGKTLIIRANYAAKVNRPDMEINFTGNGTLAYSDKWIVYTAQTATGSYQTYNYNVANFSVENRILSIGDGNFVNLGTVSTGTQLDGIVMENNSSLTFTTSDTVKIKAPTTGGNGQITLSDNNVLNITAAGLSSTDIILSGNSEFTFSGSFSAPTISICDSAYLNVTSGYVSGIITVGDGARFNFAGGSSISGKSSFGKVSETSKLGNTVYIEDGADVTVSADEGKLTVGDKIILKTAKLTLETSNAIKNVSGKYLTLRASRTSTLALGAKQNFATIFADRAAADILTIDLNGNALETDSLQTTDLSQIIFEDFAEGLVLVNSDVAKLEDDSLKNIFAKVDGQNQKLYQLSNGYLSLTSVPEPAEWASVLGALAIVLAMWRRRK